jgi:UDP-2-acetamido-2-deoxy-ribo-hexuluronate aminotransferase
LTSTAPPGLRFVDLQAQRRRLDGRIEAAIAGVLAHGQFILGPEVEQLERALAVYAGVRHAITCASGTDALVLVLMAQAIGPGDAVFVPGFTFAACAAAVALVGATPVLVDVEPASGNLDPVSVGEAIAAVRQAGRLAPRAILPVDLFGRPADYAALGPIARAHGLFVLQDAAQSFGARWGDQPVGRQGHAAATSFYPAKPLGAYGDGGAVLTDDDRLADEVRLRRTHGERRPEARYDHVRIGLNSRLDTLQAAILLVKLEALDEEIARRGALAARYDAGLGDLVDLPPPLTGGRSAWAQYTIRVNGRDRLAAALARRGIPTAVHYPRPLHRQPAFAHFPTAPGGLPVAETLAGCVLSLPIHPDLEPSDQARIIAAIRELIEKGLDPDRRQDYIGGSARPPAG